MSNPNIKDFGFGNRSKEKDDEVRRLGMEVRQANIGKPRIWTDEKIHQFIDELLDVYKKILTEDAKVETSNSKKLKQETIRDLNTMVRRLLDFKEAYYPPVQKNINLNIDMTAEKVIERLRNFKKKKIEEEENVKRDL